MTEPHSYRKVDDFSFEVIEISTDRIKAYVYNETTAKAVAGFMSGGLPWRPIEELKKDGEPSRYGDQAGFFLLAPELADLDCNTHGAGMGYWQDGPVSVGGSEYEDGTWIACKFDMTNDEWYEKACIPTHYIPITGA